MSTPATLALQGIQSYLEAHQDDDLDHDLIYKACKLGLGSEGIVSSVILPKQVREADISESETLKHVLCELTHDSLQPHQTCPVCTEIVE